MIQWYGYACFKVTSNSTNTSVIIDPYGTSAGYKLSRLSADIGISTTDSDLHNALDAVRGGDKIPVLISNPGEYEVGGIFAHGSAISQKDQKEAASWTSIYSLKVDDIFIAHLGALARDLSENERDALGRVDVLLVPVGGHRILDHKKAMELITELEPRIIIPMAYKIPGTKIELNPLDLFLKEYGVKDAATMDKLKIMKKDLPADDTKVIILTQS